MNLHGHWKTWLGFESKNNSIGFWHLVKSALRYNGKGMLMTALVFQLGAFGAAHGMNCHLGSLLGPVGSHLHGH